MQVYQKTEIIKDFTDIFVHICIWRMAIMIAQAADSYPCANNLRVDRSSLSDFSFFWSHFPRFTVQLFPIHIYVITSKAPSLWALSVGNF